MNFTSGMDIEFQTPMGLDVLLRTLFTAGWSYQANHHIRYLPPLCSGPRDWADRPASAWKEVLTDLETKHAHREVVGIVLHWRETGYVCAFQLFPDGDLSIDFGMARAMLPICGQYTDTGWYMARIVCPLTIAGARVDTIRYSEVLAVGAPWDLTLVPAL